MCQKLTGHMAMCLISLDYSFVSMISCKTLFYSDYSISETDKHCYHGDGSDGVYSGTVDYGAYFTTCMRWDEVPNCPFNQFDRR